MMYPGTDRNSTMLMQLDGRAIFTWSGVSVQLFLWTSPAKHRGSLFQDIIFDGHSLIMSCFTMYVHDCTNLTTIKGQFKYGGWG